MWKHVAASFAAPHLLAAQTRDAIDLAFAHRLRLGLGTRLFSIVWKNREKVFHTVENSAGRDSPATAESRKNRLRDGFGRGGGGGARLVQRQQGGEKIGVGQVGLPAVGGKDGGVDFAVGVHQPSGFLVI